MNVLAIDLNCEIHYEITRRHLTYFLTHGWQAWHLHFPKSIFCWSRLRKLPQPFSFRFWIFISIILPNSTYFPREATENRLINEIMSRWWMQLLVCVTYQLRNMREIIRNWFRNSLTSDGWILNYFRVSYFELDEHFRNYNCTFRHYNWILSKYSQVVNARK